MSYETYSFRRRFWFDGRAEQLRSGGLDIQAGDLDITRHHDCGTAELRVARVGIWRDCELNHTDWVHTLRTELLAPDIWKFER